MNWKDKEWLSLAVDLADAAMGDGRAPVGAVLVGSDHIIVGKGTSWTVPAGDGEKQNVSVDHAEVYVLRSCQNKLQKDMQYTLYVSLEPCHMCMGAAIVARIGRVVWALDDFWGGATRMYDTSRDYIKLRMPELVRTPYPDLQKRSAQLWVDHLDQYNLPDYKDRMLRWQQRIEL